MGAAALTGTLAAMGPPLRRVGWAAIVALLGACALEPTAPPAPQAPTPPEAPRTALEAFRREHPYDDGGKWFSLEVTRSVVTGTRRRIHFDKEAVTTALLALGGGGGFNATPMEYPPGTVFVAEGLDEDGKVRDTEVLVIGPPGGHPSFLLFGRDGSPADTFPQPNDPPGGPKPGNVPAVCLGCHEGASYFDPMMSFPEEPFDRRVVVDPRCRDLPVVRHLLEGYHRGGRLFGPYGAIWLAKVRADARDGFLAEADRPHYDRLKVKYADLFR